MKKTRQVKLQPKHRSLTWSTQKVFLDRSLKIHSYHRDKKEVAALLLSGNWIEQLGFKVGEMVRITTRDRLLIIEPEAVQQELNYQAALQEVKQTLKKLAKWRLQRSKQNCPLVKSWTITATSPTATKCSIVPSMRTRPLACRYIQRRTPYFVLVVTVRANRASHWPDRFYFAQRRLQQTWGHQQSQIPTRRSVPSTKSQTYPRAVKPLRI